MIKFDSTQTFRRLFSKINIIKDHFPGENTNLTPQSFSIPEQFRYAENTEILALNKFFKTFK
jgi:hypothetical protein